MHSVGLYCTITLTMHIAKKNIKLDLVLLDWSVYTCLTQLYSSVRQVYTLQSSLL